ncbi:hypothetical protein L4X63_17825 [Geomonas sp. Red32]|uniref:hypothetical protein n=1 Tax=Geomonas sp. Red32 TaxID=2912856 RepID=UPI00202CFFD6|nr:hypothetical protein [Geomonas sp. Red32]MCM0083447.1 hypothetical protein [Geomonas sp. Red32]
MEDHIGELEEEAIPGSTSARVLGALQIMYGLAVFVLVLLPGNPIRPLHFLMLGLAVLFVVSGIGLCKLNYYAWFFSIVLASVSIVSGLAVIVLSDVAGDSRSGAVAASQMGPPIIAFWLLYLARKACKRKR